MPPEYEARTSPRDVATKLLDAQLGGYGMLSKLLLPIDSHPGTKRKRKKKATSSHHAEDEVLPTCTGVLALQTKLSHECRVLVTGIHDRHSQSKDKSSMLRVLAKLYSRSMVPGPEAEEEDEGEQLCRFCSRDAALFAACLSSTVFLSAADTSPPPMRALVGQHFADSHWLDLLMDCLRDENCDLSSHRAIWYSLSILGNCTYDSRRARSTLLQGGPPPSSSFLPFLVKSMCRVKALAPGTRLRALCVVNNCISPQPCLDDRDSGSTEAWSTVVCAVEGLISQASLVRYLYGLLLASTTTTAQQREGLEAHQADEQEAGQAGEDDSRAAVASSSTAVEEGEARARREMGRILAAEGLLSCLAVCPSATLAALKERGAFLAFPALAQQQQLATTDDKEGGGEAEGAVGTTGQFASLMVQRFSTAMLATVADLLLPTASSRSKDAMRRQQQHLEVDDDDSATVHSARVGSSQASSSKPPRRASRSNTGSVKTLQQLSRGNGSTKGQQQQDLQQPAGKPPFSSADFVMLLTQTGSLLSLAWLLLHYDDRVQAATRRVWRYVLVQQSSRAWVEPFVEQGGVPILFRCSQQQQDGMGGGGSSNESVAMAQQVLEALQAEVSAPEMLAQLVLRTTSITVHQASRGNIAIALLLLSCGAPRIRESFVRSGGLHCILNMVHNPNMRESAVNFLAAVDSLIQQEPRPACWEVYVQQDGDSELLFEEPGNRTQGDSHKPKGPGDLVFLVENTEVNRRKTVIEMACPPADTLAKASPVLKELLEEVTVTGQRPAVQGSYKVWEEIMSHIAQPWCFGRSMGRYSPDLLVEMMTIAHRYGLWELKTVYGVRLSASLDESSAVTILHAALSVQHAWLAVEAYRVLLDSLDFVCSRSTRAVPLAVQLIEELLTNLLLS